jgi:hypothetical protein
MKSYVQDYTRKTMSELALTRVCNCDPIVAFQLAKPSTRINSCMIVFTPEGIVIMGDLVPESNHGAISMRGYGLAWFASKLGEDYLCSKFLETEYVPETAREYVAWLAKSMVEDDDESNAERHRVLSEALEADPDAHGDHFGDQGAFVELMTEADYYDAVTDGCGWDYNPRDASVLCAIQQRFSEAYTELVKQEGMH